jgi:hypothetical protein
MDGAQQRIRSAISAFARGELVIVADDDDRESEGDLFVAASLSTSATRRASFARRLPWRKRAGCISIRWCRSMLRRWARLSL